MHGPRLRGVLEMREVYDGPAFRLMFTTVFTSSVYVLCAFQKKSTRGIRTPAHQLALVRRRLDYARQLHALEASK